MSVFPKLFGLGTGDTCSAESAMPWRSHEAIAMEEKAVVMIALIWRRWLCLSLIVGVQFKFTLAYCSGWDGKDRNKLE